MIAVVQPLADPIGLLRRNKPPLPALKIWLESKSYLGLKVVGLAEALTK